MTIEETIESTINDIVAIPKQFEDSGMRRAAIRGALKGMVEIGRVSVLKDFDALTKADGLMGFTNEEWVAVKKFFAWNKQVSGWDV